MALPIALLLLAIEILTPRSSEAGVTEAWARRYTNLEGDSVDQGFRIVCDSAGDFLAVGITADLYAPQGLVIIKYSGATGSVIWQKRYNGAATFLIRLEPPSTVVGAAVDGSGNMVVTTWADGSGNEGDYYTAKYAAADGALLWERRYNGPGNGQDTPVAMVLDNSGNVFLTGSSQIGRDDPVLNIFYPTDYYTAKYAAADGALLWERRYDGPANGKDVAASIAVDPSGNVIVTGYSESSAGGYAFDYYTAKYAAADGAVMWEKRYDRSADYGDYAFAVAVDAGGNAAVTGYSYSNGKADFRTVKYAATDGALIWEKGYNGPDNGNDFPSTLTFDLAGNVVVTGASEGSGSGYDLYTAKYAAGDGALVWEKRYNGPVNGDDLPTALLVNTNGSVVVTGHSVGNSSSNDY